MFRVPVLVAAVLVAVAVAACDGDDGAAPADIVRESVERTAKVETFHFTLDIEGVPRSGTGLQLAAAEGDVAVPDRLRADVSGTFAGVSLSTRIVSVAGRTWLKNPLTGDWDEVDVDTTPAALLDPQQGVLGVMRGITDVDEDGEEEIGGVRTVRISGEADADDVAPLVAVASGGGSVDVILWIGDEDRILRRIRVEGAVAEGESSGATRVVEISRFDEAVSIEPPEGAP